MSKKKRIVAGGVIVALVAATVIRRQLAGKTTTSAQSSSDDSDKVTTLRTAHTQNCVPYGYVDENGESDGFEVAVLKAVDRKLKNYKLEYTETSDGDLLIGLESGKYDIGVKGAWYTAERAEKFVIPDEAVGTSVIGFAIRKEGESKYTDVGSPVNSGGKLVPTSPQNAQYNVIQEYNKTAKNPAELTESESFSVADAYAWVLEERYDAYFPIKLSFEEAVQNEDGAYHQYANQLTWFPYKGIETYPLIHKNATNEAFVKEYDKAIKELKEDGTIAKLSEKYFGKDVFSYVTD